MVKEGKAGQHHGHSSAEAIEFSIIYAMPFENQHQLVELERL